MLVFNIAEWIGNLFILGIAFVIWMIGILLFMIIITLAIDRIKKLKI
tara:strand:+ start:936 stop:1076 length:141 start_codon:yes stop_codon:yes gene_type:complete